MRAVGYGRDDRDGQAVGRKTARAWAHKKPRVVPRLPKADGAGVGTAAGKYLRDRFRTVAAVPTVE